MFEDTVYVLTPQGRVIDLPRGSTPVDFAYHVHSELGHRCRGAKVDGLMVPLNTQLANGQTVDILAAKTGGPSRDWLNPELGYIHSSRARAKVRQWFNSQNLETAIGQGRQIVEKLLQRAGMTALALDRLAGYLGFDKVDDFLAAVGRSDLTPRQIQTALRDPSQPDADEAVVPAEPIRAPTRSASPAKGNVLVVGVDKLLTVLAKCCKPAPPDPIRGFVTRGHGVSIHRADCSNFRMMAARDAGRVIDVEWGEGTSETASVYPVDVVIEASDRQGLLRDISDVFTREKMNVIGVQTQSVKDSAYMTFTVEIDSAVRLSQVLRIVAGVTGVRWARRR